MGTPNLNGNAGALTASNLPFQPHIEYRADDYSSVRFKLLERLKEMFPIWNSDLSSARGQQDMGVVLVELFAYMADILGLYQDARANESFLGTAVLRASLMDLCALIDSRVAPGAAASTLQAFFVKPGAKGIVPAGFKVKNKAAGGTPAFVFETALTLDADAERNELRLHSHDRSQRSLNAPNLPEDTYALLDDEYSGLKAGGFVIVDAAGVGLYPVQLTSVTTEEDKTRIDWEAGALRPEPNISAPELPIADVTIHGKPKQSMSLASRVRADEITAGHISVEVDDPSLFTTTLEPVLIVSQGLMFAARAAVAGDLLTWDRGFNLALRRSATRIHPATDVGSTTQLLRRGATRVQRTFTGTDQPEAGDQLLISDAVGVERVPVAAFAANTIYLAEPLPRTFHPIATFSGASPVDLYRVRLPAGEDPCPPGTCTTVTPLRLAISETELELDKTYDGLEPGILLVLHDGAHRSVNRLNRAEVNQDGRTVLVLDNPVGLPFKKANLTVHGPFDQAMRIDGHDRAEGGIPALQTRLTLDGAVPGLTPGDYLVIEGGGHAEGARLTSVAIDGDGNVEVDLEGQLLHGYPLADTAVYANVVPVSQGETVIEDVLGSGDRSQANQRFTLHRHPTTYVHDAEGLRGVASTLELLIDDVRWTEVESLAESGPDDPHYVVEIDDEGKMSIGFGDGRHGVKLPTGRNNVKARYRVGLGASANVGAGSLSVMAEPLQWLESTRNPLPAAGGADPETAEEIRRIAPITVRTLERAVSLSDYADLARAYAGIAKARADWDWEEGRRVVVLTVASVGGKPLTPDLKDALRGYVNVRRAPQHRLRIRDHTPVPVRLRLAVHVPPQFLRMETKVRVQRALGSAFTEAGERGYFHFERRDLGQPLYLSDVYATVENVRGVDYVVAEVFRPESATADAPAVMDRIRLRPDELATGGHPSDAAIGILNVQATGGIV